MMNANASYDTIPWRILCPVRVDLTRLGVLGGLFVCLFTIFGFLVLGWIDAQFWAVQSDALSPSLSALVLRDRLGCIVYEERDWLLTFIMIYPGSPLWTYLGLLLKAMSR